MYIIEVIPLTLLPPNMPQILSYFSGLDFLKGSVVEVTLNKRKVRAVVVSSSPLEKEKLGLKKVDFQIKKIGRILFEKPRVSDYQLKIAVWIAKYYYSPLGYTLKTILPPFAFKKKYPTTEVGNAFGIKNSDFTTGQTPQKQLLIYKTKKLAGHLKPLIKEVFNHSKQVLVLVPERTTIEYFVGELSGNSNVSVIHSGLSNTKIYEAWQNIRSGKTSLVIGTRQSLNIPFKNLGLIIVDDPLHEFYKSDMVPRYSAVQLARKIADLNNAQLILTSVVPGVENYYHYASQTKTLEPRPKFETEIVDMAQEIKNGNWSLFGKKLNEDLIARLKNNKKILIFSPRRGYAGVLICGNCSSAIKCPQCEIAMRTHRSIEMILVCHHCGISRPIPKNCSSCGSSNLKTVGPAGTQKIYEEVRSKIISVGLKAPILVLDTDVVKNETEEEEIISEILKPGPSVLIATQMVFSHRFRLNFDLIAVINADSLMNMPDFKSEENLFYQLEKLVSFLSAQAGETSKLLIQTYNPEGKIIEKAVRGDYEDFYNNELKLREALYYPPFYRIVKLTFKHKYKDKASYAARVATEKLKMAITRARLDKTVKLVEATPAYIEKEKGLYIYNIFLKIISDYQDFGDFLKYIGPGWVVDIDPRSLL